MMNNGSIENGDMDELSMQRLEKLYLKLTHKNDVNDEKDAFTSNETKNREFVKDFLQDTLHEGRQMSTADSKTADFSVWDFAGQTVFYATHQIFFTRKAVYLLVIDMSKQVNDVVEDGSKTWKISEMADFWLTSILEFCGTKDSYGPPVIIAEHFADKLKQDTLHEGRQMSTVDSKTADFSIWDFGGQTVFYATHQVFLSKKAVYLLVTDMSKQVNDVVEDGKKPGKISDFFDFWLTSIHEYCGTKDNYGPQVILVGTFADNLKKNTLHEGRQMSTVDSKTADFSIWDFGGQTVYYDSHQVFLSKKAVYLLVTDMSKQVNDVVEDDKKPGIISEFVDFWLTSIHEYCGTKDCYGPPVILVGTFADNLKKDTLHDSMQIPTVDSKTGDVIIWDFAGLTEFYDTYQVFLSKRTIYLLVTDMSKQVNDVVEDGNKNRKISEAMEDSGKHSSMASVESCIGSIHDMEEFRELEQMLKCKVCLDADLCTVFLPCRHMAVCERCADVLEHCPVCRATIENSIELNFE